MNEIPLREHSADARLRPWVECVWDWRDPGGAPGREHRVLPDGCMDVVFRAEPRGGFVGLVVGTMTRPLVMMRDRAATCVGVRFRSGRARRFLRVPASELVDASAPLADVLPAETREIRSELADTDDPARARRAIERFLLERLARDGDADDALVGAGVRLLRESGGRASVDRLARDLGASRQHLTRLFRRDVGLGPKAYARVLRFRAAVAALADAQRAPLAALADDLGYFDQAHLANEFRSLSGLSPSAWLAQSSGDVPFLQDASARRD